MKKIHHTDTLVYYGGAQVFEGRDVTGGCYVGVLTDSIDNTDHYVVTRVSPKWLKRFRAGELDLRTLMVEGSESIWYLTQTCSDFADALALREQSGPISDTDFLPEDDFLMCEPTSSAH